MVTSGLPGVAISPSSVWRRATMPAIGAVTVRMRSVGAAGAGRGLRRLVVRLGLVQRRPADELLLEEILVRSYWALAWTSWAWARGGASVGLARVDAHQHLARLDALAGVDAHFDHRARTWAATVAWRTASTTASAG